MIEGIVIIAILSLLILLAGKKGLAGKIGTGIYMTLAWFFCGIFILVLIAGAVGMVVYFIGGH